MEDVARGRLPGPPMLCAGVHKLALAPLLQHLVEDLDRRGQQRNEPGTVRLS